MIKATFIEDSFNLTAVI